MVTIDFNCNEELDKDERWWVERTELFNRRGYVLRQRYRPGWTPSWKRPDNKNPYCEDSLGQLVRPRANTPIHN